MNQTLDIKRLWLTIVREFALNKINLLIIAASMILVCLVVTYVKGALTPIEVGVTEVHHRFYNSYPVVVLIYCVVVTAFIFHDLNLPDKEIDYLMLPSFSLEKYLTKFLLTTIGFGFLAGFALSINTMQVNFLNGGRYPTNYSKIIEPNYWKYLHGYLIIHSVFFFGSVYFRKMELAKTILSIISLLTILYFFTQFLREIGLVDLMKLKEYLAIGYSGFNNEQNQVPTIQSINKLRGVYSEVESISKWVISYLAPPLFWIMGFVRLREIEVKDGI
ncbi:MAG: hypothetical protein Q8L04_08655 [Ignavibacteria bacterium]|nr:hypothetical protein [Ignavibacteria bacterium]